MMRPRDRYRDPGLWTLSLRTCEALMMRWWRGRWWSRRMEEGRSSRTTWIRYLSLEKICCAREVVRNSIAIDYEVMMILNIK